MRITSRTKRKRSKLGRLLDQRKLTLKDFASMVYDKTGYLIQIQNLSTYCSGYRKIVRIDTAMRFADTLGVELTEIL